VKIEKGRPLPRSYPFGKMEVGDSFLIPKHIRPQTVQIAAVRYWHKTKKKFSVRKTEDGYCCWRVE
jgi:hypothetical protein